MTTTTSAFTTPVLAGRHVFITGGTSGINLGIAHRFAAAGAKLTLLGRNADKAQAAADEVQAAHGGEVLAVTADVRDAAALGAAVKQGVDAHGLLDVLVCGAAGNFVAPALGMSPNGFKSVVDIDLLGTFNACRVAFEHLKQPGACVLNISAPQAYLPTAFQAHVCAAKAGVDMLTKTLALEWGPIGIRVNSLVPGAVEGTEGMARLAATDEIKQTMMQKLPLQRFTTPAEIAEVALFLVSPSAAYVTGSVIVADGGLSLIGMNALSGM